MSYEFYKVLHLTGIFAVVIALGGIGLHAMNGGSRDHASRKILAMVHGIGLLISLVAGFGLLARLGIIAGFPAWASLKLIIWLLLGALPAVFYRKPALAKPAWWAIWVLASLSGWLAITKPF